MVLYMFKIVGKKFFFNVLYLISGYENFKGFLMLVILYICIVWWFIWNIFEKVYGYKVYIEKRVFISLWREISGSVWVLRVLYLWVD